MTAHLPLARQLGLLAVARAGVGPVDRIAEALLFALFIFSTFTRTGIDVTINFLLGAALYRLLFRGPRDPLPWWVVAPVFGWVGVSLVSSFANPNFVTNLIQWRGLFRLFVPMAMLPILFRINVRRLLAVYVVFIVIMGVYALAQHFMGINWLQPGGQPLEPIALGAPGEPAVYRSKGVFLNPIYFSSVMLLTVPFFLSLAVADRGPWRRWWVVGGVMGLVAVYASLTRGAWVGLFFALLVLALRLPRRWAAATLGIGVGLFVLIAALAATGWLQRQVEGAVASPSLRRIAGTTMENSRERLYRWEAGWRAIKENPWIGVGPDKDMKAKVIPHMVAVSKDHGGYHYRLKPTGLIHNVYLQVAFHFGWIGLAAALSVWVAVFWWAGLWIARAGRDFPFETAVLWGACGALAGALVDGFFNDNLLNGVPQNAIMLYMGLALHAGMVIRKALRERAAGEATPAAAG